MATYSPRPLIENYQMTTVTRNNIPYQNNQGTEAQRTLFTVPTGKVLIPHAVFQQQVNPNDSFASPLIITAFGQSTEDTRSGDVTYVRNEYVDLLNFDQGLVTSVFNSTNNAYEIKSPIGGDFVSQTVNFAQVSGTYGDPVFPGTAIIHNAPQINGGNVEDYNIKIYFWLADLNYDITRP